MHVCVCIHATVSFERRGIMESTWLGVKASTLTSCLTLGKSGYPHLVSFLFSPLQMEENSCQPYLIELKK